MTSSGIPPAGIGRRGCSPSARCLPDLPLFQEQADKAERIFKRLKIVDIEGQPTMGEVCAQWVFDFAGAIFGCYVSSAAKARLIQDFFLMDRQEEHEVDPRGRHHDDRPHMNRRHFGSYLIIAPTKEIAENSFVPAYGMITSGP